MGKIKIDTEIKKLYASHALRWCMNNLGVNKRKKTNPKISVRIRFKSLEEKTYNGCYHDNENRIIVYDLNCNSLEDVVSTVIHEYTHYLQSMKKYWEYFETYYYSNHPFEVQARKNEEKYTKKCIRSIKKSINNL